MILFRERGARELTNLECLEESMTFSVDQSEKVLESCRDLFKFRILRRGVVVIPINIVERAKVRRFRGRVSRDERVELSLKR